MREPALWDRIRLYPFPPVPAGQSGATERPASALAARLQQAEGWAPDYADQAVEEYRRFVYLARVSKEQVTPSEIVDRVWHEHVTDSRAYVDGFCRTLFGELFHHVPGDGPRDMPRYEAQYDRTRALYADEFGADPPGDIWIYRSPTRIRADRRAALFARIAGIMGGIALALICNRLFGWVMGAGFVGLVAGSILTHLLMPKIAGPRYASRNGDSGGCSGCGD